MNGVSDKWDARVVCEFEGNGQPQISVYMKNMYRLNFQFIQDIMATENTLNIHIIRSFRTGTMTVFRLSLYGLCYSW